MKRAFPSKLLARITLFQVVPLAELGSTRRPKVQETIKLNKGLAILLGNAKHSNMRIHLEEVGDKAYSVGMGPDPPLTMVFNLGSITLHVVTCKVITLLLTPQGPGNNWEEG